MNHQVANSAALSDFEMEIIDEVSVDEPWALLEEFSKLERVSGTDEEAQAAEYITNRLDEFGVEYQRYDPELYISQPHDATIQTLNREFEFGPVKTVSFAASTTVLGEVEYVGSAGTDLLSQDEDAHEPYTDVDDLTGTIALTAAGSLSIRATRILEEKGAVGVIAIHEHDREPHNGIATPIWGGAPRLDEKEQIPEIPIVNVRKPDGQQLREWAEDEDELEVELETDLTTEWMKCPIVVAEIEGSGDTDEFVLLHGHYDSWYVGITDNATGDAGLLELARVFGMHSDKLNRNLRVAWWPGHSTGRYAGSTWYADEFALDLAENCIAQVNMDSPGAKGATEYTDMSCWTPEAHELVGETIDDVTGAPYAENHPFRAGDYSFDNLGITGFFMLSSNIPADVREENGWHPVGGCGGNSDAWHVSTDTLDKAGKEELVRDICVYAASLTRVLNANVLPFDHSRNADRLIETVTEYNEAAGDAFDFEPTLAELRPLRNDIVSFQEAAHDGEIDASEANNIITDLSRVLTRLNLVQRDQFEQDPAVKREPIPRYAPARKFEFLTGNDRKFLQIQLKREQNGVIHELRQARDLLREV
jgi:N-acetylated-alpha-linked acidic dipeptidase